FFFFQAEDGIRDGHGLEFRRVLFRSFDSLKIEVAEVPRLILFMVVAAFMATMSAARRRAENSLKSAREELEVRVRDRTADLQRRSEERRVGKECRSRSGREREERKCT